MEIHTLRSRLVTRLSRSPAGVTFLLSLLLSLIATLNAGTVGSDAALYLDIAQIFTEEGWQATYRQFDWPWFSILLAVLHGVTHIPLELLAYGVCALLMAGACALMVRFLAGRVPELGWWACLVVLSVPAFNDYRGEILREYGYWFFAVLALTLCASWAERRGWLRVAAVYAAIMAAMLFRLEALFLAVAVCTWQLLSIRCLDDLRRAAELLFFPLAGSVLALLLYMLFAEAADLPRVSNFLMLLNPGELFESLQQMSAQFADSMISRHSREDAGKIVLFGVIATLLFKFWQGLGPFAVLIFYRQGLGQIIGRFQPFGWACFFYFIVLVLFFLQTQFVSGRYISMLGWLAVPFVAFLAMTFAHRYPRSSKVLAVVNVLVMLANVVSLSPTKTHYKDGAQWVAEHVPPSAAVYFQERRMYYYAGRRIEPVLPVDQVIGSAASGFDYFVLEFAAADPRLADFLTRERLHALISFENSGGEVVTIFARSHR